jgi:formylglycine-generating enzyme required for sulfatase activity
MNNGDDSDSLFAGDSPSPYSRDVAQLPSSGGIGLRQGEALGDELSILRRRLQLAREENGRLGDALASERTGSRTRQRESEGRLQSLERELEDLRRSFDSKEQALVEATENGQRLREDLENRVKAFDKLQSRFQHKKRELEAKKEAVARLEKEQQELQAAFKELSGELALAAYGHGHASSTVTATDTETTPAPDRASLVRTYFLPIAQWLIIGTLFAALIYVGLRPRHVEELFSSDPPDFPSEVPEQSTDKQVSMFEKTARELVEPLKQTDVREVALSGAPQPLYVEEIRERLKVGSPGPTLIALNAGHFRMGSRPEFGTDDANPIREVRIGKFLMGVYEVTFDEYDLFARSTGRRLPNDFGWGRGKHPVVDVTWRDAQAYADWLSSQTGRGYRLPSEAEWEYAARAGSSSPYWWGRNVDSGRAVCFECGSQWDNRSTAPVASFAPNPFGLYDTSGNAMEWVADCYHANYVAAPSDGRAWIVPGACRYRVARGGAFNKPARSMRNAARHRFASDTRLNMLGIRVARDPE